SPGERCRSSPTPREFLSASRRERLRPETRTRRRPARSRIDFMAWTLQRIDRRLRAALSFQRSREEICHDETFDPDDVVVPRDGYDRLRAIRHDGHAGRE